MSTVEEAVADLVDHRLPVEQAVDRHYAAGFRQRTDGRWDDRPALVALATRLREAVEHATVTVLDELASGDRYAERHVVELVLRDGTRTRREVSVFARRDADGRFTRIEETTRPLDEAEAAVDTVTGRGCRVRARSRSIGSLPSGPARSGPAG